MTVLADNLPVVMGLLAVAFSANAAVGSKQVWRPVWIRYRS